MIPWEFIDSAKTPDKIEELKLYRRGTEFSIRVGGLELMNSRVYGSEKAIAELSCSRIKSRKNTCILIGGLGMGFTLSATLKYIKPDTKVMVAELVPEVVRWNRDILGELADYPLKDNRVTILETDVVQLLKKEKNAFDAVILDVDNGPEGLTQKGNDWLYSAPGLIKIIKALRPEGILAVWSANPDRSFTTRLTKAGFKVEEKRVRARENRKGGRHTIWIATRP